VAAKRDHDIVLFGCTGFTGALTAEYLAKNAGDTRWALAGRNRQKLEQLRERLGLPELPVLVADVTDPPSLRDVAASSRALVTTVGPYIRYGEPLVAACAEEGTDYLDLTGEPEFADLVYVRHHARAQETGARLVHACGFDSIPADLGAYFTVLQLPEGVPLRVECFVRAGGRPSGGTLDSTITAFSRARQMVEAGRARRKVEPRPEGRHVHGERGLPRRAGAVDAWAIPMPTIDPQIVLRSARALDRYGPDFTYGHYAAVKRLPVALGAGAGLAGLFVLAQIPPARERLRRRVAGSGPSPEQREKSWFNFRFTGEGGGRRVVTEVSGGDPGYGETAKMLAESALCIANDDLPKTAGQVTTAQAMGERLIERLQRAGIRFEVVEGGPTEAAAAHAGASAGS
jgi:saccharopine dehydrogenase (NAD+, L-glutamate forming)